MNSTLLWSIKHSKNVSCVAISPDNSRLVASNESKVNIYDLQSGKLLVSPRGHKGTVSCVTFSNDSSKLASGGTDGTVVIWSKEGEGILKYNHSDPVKCVQFSPALDILASFAQTELGFWSSSTKSVVRYRHVSKPLCASWTKDGRYIAFGFQNGSVGIRRGPDDSLAPCANQPIVKLCWTSSASNDQDDILVVCTWSSMIFFKRDDCSLTLLEKTKKMNFYTLTMNSLSTSYGDYLLLGGSNCSMHIYSRDGSLLSSLPSPSSEWISSSSCNDKYLCTAGSNGTVSLFKYSWNRIICHYSNIVAFSESLSDVLIEVLNNSSKRVRIRCRDMVQSLSLCHHQLIILLFNQSTNSHRINVYHDDDDNNLHYKLKDRLALGQLLSGSSLPVKLSVINSDIIISQGCQLFLISSSSSSIKQLVYPSSISCLYSDDDNIRMIASSDGFLEVNSFKTNLHLVVTVMSISAKKSKILMLDDKKKMHVYHRQKLTMVESDLNDDVVFICCHADDDDVAVAFTTNKTLMILALSSSSVVSSLHCPVDDVISISSDGHLYAFVDGVIVKHHLSQLFGPITDHRMMGHVRQIMSDDDDDECNYKLLVRDLIKKGQLNQAVMILADMCQFDQIRQINKMDGVISTRESEWLLMMGDVMKSSHLLTVNGDHRRSMDLLMNNYAPNIHDQICDGLVSIINCCNDGDVMNAVADFLASRDDVVRWKACMMKLGNIDKLIEMLIKKNVWDEAISLLSSSSSSLSDKAHLYRLYADHLKSSGDYEESIKHYQLSGDYTSSHDLLSKLADGAIQLNNYQSACRYYCRMSVNSALAKDRSSSDKYQAYSRICLGYKHISELNLHGLNHESPEMMINCLCFVVNMIHRDDCICTELRLSKATCLVSLARLSYQLKYYKLSRNCLDALSSLAIMDIWAESVDAMNILLQSKPHRDENLPHCCRCGSIGQLLTHDKRKIGLIEVCSSCYYPIIRCGLTFEILPLVEFKLNDDLNDVEVVELLSSNRRTSDEAFNNCMLRSLQSQSSRNDASGGSAFEFISVGKSDLSSISRYAVFSLHDLVDGKSRWFVNVQPELKVGFVSACQAFFSLHEIELELLRHGSICPISGIGDIDIIYHV